MVLKYLAIAAMVGAVEARNLSDGIVAVGSEESTALVLVLEEVIEEVEVVEEVAEDPRSLTIYPEPFLSNEQVQQGGFILYILGKLSICHPGQWLLL